METMKLSEYLSENNLTQADFARVVGESPQNIERYVNGKRKPSDETVMQRIADATKGEVTANDFYGITTANGHKIIKVKLINGKRK